MSELTEDIADGSCCMICGQYFSNGSGGIYSHGYPVLCWGCFDELTPEEKIDPRVQRALKPVL